jgi:hypothetical protein
MAVSRFRMAVQIMKYGRSGMVNTVYIVVNDGIVSEVYTTKQTANVIIVNNDAEYNDDEETVEYMNEIEQLVETGALFQQY